MQTRPSFRLLICGVVTLFWIACNFPPSNASPVPSAIFALPALQSTASPTPGAALSQTESPTETPPPNETPSLSPTSTGAPTTTPAFDITKRTGQPSIDNQSDYL